MDTRTKIVNPPQAERLAAAGFVVVSGYFDPLLAWHSERLAQAKGSNARLLVLIATPQEPILPARARAELVAGLAIVDHVAEFSPGLKPQVRLEAEEEARLEALIEHVHSRQKQAS